jgi:hypothetical protein
MSESIEAEWLRLHWSEEYLGRYRSNWVAVRGREVIASGENLEDVMDKVNAVGYTEEKPLYAFVYFGELQ